MLLQMNSCSGFSLKYHPLQPSNSVKTLRLPSTQINGLVNRSQRKKYSVKCSSQSSFSLTNKVGNREDIINRNHKPLNKSTVALALQDGYASKSEEENTLPASFVQVLNKKFDALYRLTRPYTWASIIVGVLSVSMLAVQSPTDLTATYFIEVLKSMVPAIMMNNFVNAINQLSDVEIDKVNKPHLPLASGDFSIAEGIAIAIGSPMMGVAMGMMLRSPPLVICFIIWWIVGAAYSLDLPLLRWKGSPIMAAVTIIILNGLLLQFPYFVHFQKYVLGRPVVFPKQLLFAAAIMPIFNAAIAFSKDLPDVEGDKEFGLRTLPIILGRERVFSIAVNMLLTAYGAGVVAGATSPFLPCKIVAIIGHSALAALLWRKAQTVDLTDPPSMQSFYMFIFKLYYAEFFLMHFVR
ncbi:coumarin 8-geranyltransferase 1b, chloroplastic [Citrus clementina]|uniref:coumarin 8-geranyltransferase 1b, chloroplastic n=1 Tax=Citrus clementina TaxID=85681 RepID=UPI000CED5E7E|nr:coumarin 8-geranyltransferase 1b, chloroplastic [Citrus x clementina]